MRHPRIHKHDGIKMRQADLVVKTADMPPPISLQNPPHLAVVYREQFHHLFPPARLNGPPSWVLPRGDMVCMLLSVKSRLIGPLPFLPASTV